MEPPRHICNLVKDINMLVKKVENISFVYCRRSENELANRIANVVIRDYTIKVVVNEYSSFKKIHIYILWVDT